MAILPVDLLHLLSEQLAQDLDFPTLYNCVVSSKHFANSGAIAALYRVSHESPVKGASSDALPLDVLYLTVQKWSVLWRTILLSALGKTMYPYCHHLRFLDLRDLEDLLTNETFKRDMSKTFFSTDLSRFRFTRRGIRSLEYLDGAKIVSAVGDEITQKAPFLEAISEPPAMDIMTNSLPTWIPRLQNLRRLDLFDGRALADEQLRNLLHAHCPNLAMLNIFRASGQESDHALATFISGMPENKLTSFENHNDCGIATETLLAMNHHSKSLTHLKLSLTEAGILALAYLQGCTALTLLSIEGPHGSFDLKATQNDSYLEIVDWLSKCNSLKDVSFVQMISAPDLMMPILLNKNVSLEELEIHARDPDAMYIMKDHHDFHQALTQQQTLRRLHLNANPEPPSRDELEFLLNCLCSLKGLHELRLDRISEYFSDEHISLLARHLTELKDLSIGGYGISDAALLSLLHTNQLKSINFAGVTIFTANGIKNFIEKLGPDNAGLILNVEMADPDTALEDKDVDMLKDLLTTQVNGRFNYELLRDPNVPEYYGSDDSD